ncbi:Acyl-CoA thioesterase 2 [Dictyocoela muelleri]|nr:Acyl-CoA thioesterase 2 [Dictyocoela muelleri]
MNIHGIKKICENKYETINLWSVHPSGRAFGGHIISKALESALLDSSNIVPNSMSVYFHRPVMNSEKLIFEVSILRKGNSLVTKRISGYQNEQLMVTIDASFDLYVTSIPHNTNFLYQKKLINPQSIPEFISHEKFIKKGMGKQFESFNNFFEIFDIAITQTDDKKRVVRVRIKNEYKDDLLKYSLIAFLSDLFLIESSLVHLNLNFFSKKLHFLASIDHKIFFKSINFNKSIILVSECLSIYNSKVVCIGQILNEDYELLATTIQQGMIKYDK